MANNIGVAPKIQDFQNGDTHITQWSKELTDRMKIYSGSSDPTTTSVPQNQWIIFYNTSLSELRLWVNLNGVMKKSAVLT